ncbi:MAG: hypothetical protein ACI4GW_09930 [Lachnospiraceae bacterium]
MKKGELEARIILEKFGIEFDDTYGDENCGKSMPDLKYKDGRYLEVTHTRHNNAIYREVREYVKKTIDEQSKISQEATDAIYRVRHGEYEKEDFRLSVDGLKQYKKDCNLLKEYMGYNPASFDEPFSEFKCDIPTIQFSADNVLREISMDKAKKYPNGDVDLFVFVAEEEYEYFFKIFHELQWNGYANNCFKSLLKSPFQVIYICVWDIMNQKYEIDMPNIRKLEKITDNGIQVTTLGEL